jgi:hypothetical protein
MHNLKKEMILSALSLVILFSAATDSVLVTQAQTTDQPSITIVSPNGGEKWSVSDGHTVTWTANASGPFDIYLLPYVAPCTGICPKIGIQLIPVAKGVSGMSYNMPSPASLNVIPGKYKMEACFSGGYVCGMSADYFTISSTGGGSSKPASIKLIDPNGGERWSLGDVHEIKWNVNGGVAGDKVIVQVAAYLPPCTTQICPHIVAMPTTIVSGIDANQRSYKWTTGLLENGWTLTPNQYVISICLMSDQTICDNTNKYFTIIATSAPQLSAALVPMASSSVSQTVAYTLKYDNDTFPYSSVHVYLKCPTGVVATISNKGRDLCNSSDGFSMDKVRSGDRIYTATIVYFNTSKQVQDVKANAKVGGWWGKNLGSASTSVTIPVVMIGSSTPVIKAESTSTVNSAAVWDALNGHD